LPRSVNAFFCNLHLFSVDFLIKGQTIIFVVLQPHSPDNRALARECKNVKTDRVYIGSCTGGKTEDFIAAAKVFLASVRRLNPMRETYNQDCSMCIYVLVETLMASIMYLMLVLYNDADGYVLAPGYLIFALLFLHEITVSVI
jgi:hypothetical protein